MNIILLVPRVVQGFKSRFPEAVNNAYKYFNYDRRIVEERVPRGDVRSQYKGPDDLTDADYDALVKYAKTILNPVLMKYSPRVACEDALHQAIKSYGNGMFDGKINSGRWSVLLNSMADPAAACPCLCTMPYKLSAKKKEKTEEKPKTTKIPMRLLKQMGITRKDLPATRQRAQRGRPTGPVLWQKGTGMEMEKKADGNDPNEYMVDFLELIGQLPTKDMDVLRKIIGRWHLSKDLIKRFLADCLKDSGLDKDYVKTVTQDVTQSFALLDKLEDLCDKAYDLDMEEIKTHIEPLQDLLRKLEEKGGEQPEQGAEPAPEESSAEEEPAGEEETQEISNKGGLRMAIENAKQYTERLDKIAEEIEKISPEAALQIDMISDVIDGKREASTLIHDADEARYMANRFNYDTRKRDSDEPFMDDYKKSNFEQVMNIRKHPEAIKKNASLPYQKIQAEEAKS